MRPGLSHKWFVMVYEDESNVESRILRSPILARLILSSVLVHIILSVQLDVHNRGCCTVLSEL